jgi:N-acetylneuraminic acid mutarotase
MEPIALALQVYAVGGTPDSGDVEAQSNPFRKVTGGPGLGGIVTVTDTWSEVSSLTTPRFGHAVSVGSDHRLYAIGGRSNPGAELLKKVEAFGFTPKPGWAAAASMSIGRERAAAALGHDGKIYVAGGSNASNVETSSPLDTLEAYDATTNTWKTLKHMQVARDCPAAATGTDGKIYVMGGLGTSAFLSSVEAYDPATNSWAYVASMITARSGLGAVMAPDGQIYAIGGTHSGAEALATVEVYNFTSKSWSAGLSLATARANLAVAVGPSGLIFAIGGNTSFLGPTASVEALSV